MFKKSFHYFLCLLMLAGCGKKKIEKIEPSSIESHLDVITQADNNSSNIAHEDRHYIIEMQGIECAWCAKAAMNQLKSLDGVENIKFLTQPTNEAEHALVSLDWKYSDRELDVELLKKRLSSEGFTFIAMRENEPELEMC